MIEILCGAALTLLCLGGVVMVLDIVSGWLLTPREEGTMIVLVPIRGHCEDAELILRGALYRVQGLGGKDCKRLFCVDCGMDEETRRICEYVCKDEAIELINPDGITAYFRCNAAQNDV